MLKDAVYDRRSYTVSFCGLTRKENDIEHSAVFEGDAASFNDRKMHIYSVSSIGRAAGLYPVLATDYREV